MTPESAQNRQEQGFGCQPVYFVPPTTTVAPSPRYTTKLGSSQGFGVISKVSPDRNTISEDPSGAEVARETSSPIIVPSFLRLSAPSLEKVSQSQAIPLGPLSDHSPYTSRRHCPCSLTISSGRFSLETGRALGSMRPKCKPIVDEPRRPGTTALHSSPTKLAKATESSVIDRFLERSATRSRAGLVRQPTACRLISRRPFRRSPSWRLGVLAREFSQPPAQDALARSHSWSSSVSSRSAMARPCCSSSASILRKRSLKRSVALPSASSPRRRR